MLLNEDILDSKMIIVKTFIDRFLGLESFLETREEDPSFGPGIRVLETLKK